MALDTNQINNLIAANSLTGNDAEIATAINALPSRYRSVHLTINDLTNVVGSVAAAGMRREFGQAIEMLRQAGGDANLAQADWLEDALGFLKGIAQDAQGQTGLDFGSEAFREAIASLAAGNPTGPIAQAQSALIAISDTYGGDVTEADVTAAQVINARTNAINSYRTAKDAEYQTTVEAAQASRDADVAAYELLVEAWDGTGDPPTGV